MDHGDTPKCMTHTMQMFDPRCQCYKAVRVLGDTVAQCHAVMHLAGCVWITPAIRGPQHQVAHRQTKQTPPKKEPTHNIVGLL